jgi:predicted glycosyl hydrolase (DUF1957 family)
MAKGYQGESGSDKAFNVMDKYMKKSKGKAAVVPATLLEALKAQYPDTWRHEISKMRAEHKANSEPK